MAIVDEIMELRSECGNIVVEETLAMVEKALKFLDERQLMIFKMRRAGKTYNECSLKIGRSRGRIRLIYKQALGIIKLYVESDGEYPHFQAVCHPIENPCHVNWDRVVDELRTNDREELEAFYKLYDRNYVEAKEVFPTYERSIRRPWR